MGEVQGRGVEVGHPGAGKGRFGDGGLQSAGAHQELAVVQLPAGEVPLDEAVVDVVHAHRGEGLHAMLMGEVGDDPQRAGAGVDQGLEVDRVRVHVVGTVQLLTVAVDGLDTAVVGGDVTGQDRPTDGGHGGSRQGLEPGRQEAFHGGGSRVHENRRVAVEDHAALQPLRLGRLSLRSPVLRTGGEQTQEHQCVDSVPDTGAARDLEWNVRSGVGRRFHGSSGSSNAAI